MTGIPSRLPWPMVLQVVSVVAAVALIVATWEIWGALLNGGRLEVIPREVVLSPAALADAIRERGITSIDVTTALFNQLAREVPDAFRSVADAQMGGEAADPGWAREVLAKGPPRRLINSYGPCECTTTATWLASSRVGSSTIAWVFGSAVSIASTSGMPKAPVLPLPVWARTIRSPPARMWGIAAVWTGVGVCQPRSRIARWMSGATSAKSSESSVVAGSVISRGHATPVPR